MASLAKMNHAAKAREIVGHARDILGGNGILLENHVARHHADMEAIFTFEGTDTIQSLIVGREITGSGNATLGVLDRPLDERGHRPVPPGCWLARLSAPFRTAYVPWLPCVL